MARHPPRVPRHRLPSEHTPGRVLGPESTSAGVSGAWREVRALGREAPHAREGGESRAGVGSAGWRRCLGRAGRSHLPGGCGSRRSTRAAEDLYPAITTTERSHICFIPIALEENITEEKA